MNLNKSFVLSLAASALCLAGIPARSDEPAPAAPVFLADLPNPNDFSLFANGGWDGNWYVGFNNCWIQKVAVPAGKYRKVFIGARLGRMKNYQPPGRAPWEKRAFPGEIYMAVSSTAAWTRNQSYFLTSAEDIPFEPDPENAVEGAGESRWFWTEVPAKLVNLKGDNYLALWSPSKFFTSASSSPILAAGWGTKEVDSWLANDIRGVPPSNEAKALSTPITVFEPAIAMKLIPEDAPLAPPQVKILKVEDGKAVGRMPAPKVLWSRVEGASVERAWVEISSDAASKNWTRFGRSVWSAPYCFTLKTQDLPIGPEGKTWARVGAADDLENVGYSPAINLFEEKRP